MRMKFMEYGMQMVVQKNQGWPHCVSTQIGGTCLLCSEVLYSVHGNLTGSKRLTELKKPLRT